jgi:hypothetical protein
MQLKEVTKQKTTYLFLFLLKNCFCKKFLETLICHTGDIIAAIKIPTKLAQFTTYDFLFYILAKRQLNAKLWYSLQSEIANLIFNGIKKDAVIDKSIKHRDSHCTCPGSLGSTAILWLKP